jgi:hypothetical protein
MLALKFSRTAMKALSKSRTAVTAFSKHGSVRLAPAVALMAFTAADSVGWERCPPQPTKIFSGVGGRRPVATFSECLFPSGSPAFLNQGRALFFGGLRDWANLSQACHRIGPNLPAFSAGCFMQRGIGQYSF